MCARRAAPVNAGCLVQLPVEFGENVWIRPSAVNLVQLRRPLSGPAGNVLDLWIEGRSVMLSAHTTDPDAAAALLARVLGIIRGAVPVVVLPGMGAS